MPTSTYDLIASNVLGSATANITFTSIPDTYRDLVLVMSITSAVSDFYPGLRFNSDTGNNYNYCEARGNGTSASSFNGSSETFGTIYGAFASTTTGADYVVHILDYATTNKHKMFLARSNRSNQLVAMNSGRWANTNSAISSITIGSFGNGNTAAAGSTFYLYGIVS